MPSPAIEHIIEHPQSINRIIMRFGEDIRKNVERGMRLRDIDVDVFPEFFLGPEAFQALNLPGLDIASRAELTYGFRLKQDAFTEEAFKKISAFRDGLDVSNDMLKKLLNDMQQKLQAQFPELSASDNIIADVSINMANELTAIKQLIAAIEHTKFNELTDNIKTQEECQQAILHIMQNEMMHGLEQDAEAQAIKARFEENYQRNNFANTPSSKEAIGLTLRFQKELGVRRKQVQQLMLSEQQFKTAQQIGLNIIEAASQLAQLTQSPELANFTKTIAIGMRLSEGVYQVEKASSLLVNGLSLAGITALSGGMAALLGVATFLFDDNQGSETAVIQQTLIELWREIRSDFQHTWRLLESMEDNNAKRFLISCRYFEDISGETKRIRQEQISHFQHLQAALATTLHTLQPGIIDLMDAEQRQTILEIVNADDSYLKANFPKMIAGLYHWLSVTASNPAKTGFHNPEELRNVYNVLAVLNVMTTTPHMAGFFSALTSAVCGFPAQSLISDLSYPHVLEAYAFMGRYRGVFSEPDRQRILAELRHIDGQALQTRALIEQLQGDWGRAVMSALTMRYNVALTAIGNQFNARLEAERQELNRTKISDFMADALPNARDMNLLNPQESLAQTLERTKTIWEDEAFISAKFSRTHIFFRGAKKAEVNVICFQPNVDDINFRKKLAERTYKATGKKVMVYSMIDHFNDDANECHDEHPDTHRVITSAWLNLAVLYQLFPAHTGTGATPWRFSTSVATFYTDFQNQLLPALEETLTNTRKAATQKLMTHDAAFLEAQLAELEMARRSILAFQQFMQRPQSTNFITAEQIRCHLQAVVHHGSIESVNNVKAILAHQGSPSLAESNVPALPLYQAMKKSSDTIATMLREIETVPISQQFYRNHFFAQQRELQGGMSLGAELKM